MLLALSLIYLSLLSILPAAFTYLEYRQWWTLRLKISCLLPWRLLTTAATLASLKVLYSGYHESSIGNAITEVLLAASCGIFGITILRFLLPLAESRRYVHVRWQAWAGSSRTGIPFHLARYVGDESDWQSLRQSCSSQLPAHPVESFLSLVSPLSQGMVEDPTALLTARFTADENMDTIWLPRSEGRAGVYAPTSEPERSISLLWGSSLGFRPRCSRGIISIPTRYLGFRPTLANGLDARPICIAHGILARNKGLEPQRLICNLSSPQLLRTFEENSVLWPRPAKTLRSFYREEFTKSFSGLGNAYITAATELALLIADMKYPVLQDWLCAELEHQDLRLNNRVADLGATTEDLDRLYRCHYAAMLVSLSLHKAGQRIRPELLVFARLARSEGVEASAPWLEAEDMQQRMAEERAFAGKQGLRSINVIV